MRAWVAAAAAALAMTLTGCSVGLPFAAGNEDDATTVTVELANVANLVPNAEVKVDDVTVGSVSRLRAEGWTARVDVRLQPGVTVPANADATVGQKSLLGAQYLQLAVPPGRKPLGALRSGDVIPLARSGTYPPTEDLLIALSTVLNGSGLSRLKTITAEMNRALNGRTDDVRALLENMNTVMARLNAQRDDITTAIDRLDRFSRTTARQSAAFDRSIGSVAPGLGAINAQRPALVRALKAIDELNAVAAPTIRRNQQDLTQEVRRLLPALNGLRAAGDDLPDSFNIAFTVLFPLNTIPNLFHGDYVNLFPIADLRTSVLQRNLFGDQTRPPTQAATSVGGLLTGGAA